MKKENILTATYTVLEPNTYLVVTTDESRLVDYCIQMNERNHIPGLLEAHRQIMDGKTKLYYDITGKKRLTNALGSQKLTRAQGEHLLRSLFTLFHLLPEYFLRVGMCLLDLEYLFVDEHFNTFLPLLPLSGSEEESSSELREFFLALLGQCCVGERTEPYFDRMVKYLIRPDFSMEQMEALALPKMPSMQTAAVMPQSGSAAPVKPPADLPRSAAVPPAPTPAPAAAADRKKKAEKTVAPPLGVGFAIPGVPKQTGASAPPSCPTPPQKPMESKRKKEGAGLLSIFGGKKDRASVPPPPPQLDMGTENHLLTGAVPPPVVTSLEDEEWQGTVSLDDFSEATVIVDSPLRFGPFLTYGGKRIELTSFPFTIGKSGCSLNINNPRVSRCHATIFMENGAYFFQDEGSTNHTYMEDGAPLPPYTPCRLTGRHTFMLANEKIEIEVGGEA